jgi:hypothetical protein
MSKELSEDIQFAIQWLRGEIGSAYPERLSKAADSVATLHNSSLKIKPLAWIEDPFIKIPYKTSVNTIIGTYQIWPIMTKILKGWAWHLIIDFEEEYFIKEVGHCNTKEEAIAAVENHYQSIIKSTLEFNHGGYYHVETETQSLLS